MVCRAPTASQTCAGTQTGASLSYDNEGRLGTWQNTPSSPTTTDSFLYDGAGNRIEQVVQQQSGVGTTDTVYVGGLEEVTTTTPTGGQPTTSTTAYYGSIALSVNGGLSFLVSDTLGSAEEALDSGGHVTASRLYTPYGDSRYSTGTFPTDAGFTGYLSDSATGLDYANARYYDPLAGQFGSADPSGGSGLNGFGYVGGSPETATDPSGLTVCEDTCGSGNFVEVEGAPGFSGDSGATGAPTVSYTTETPLDGLYGAPAGSVEVDEYLTDGSTITVVENAQGQVIGGIYVIGGVNKYVADPITDCLAQCYVGGVTDVVNGPTLKQLRSENTPTTQKTPTPTTESGTTGEGTTAPEDGPTPDAASGGARQGRDNGCGPSGGGGNDSPPPSTLLYHGTTLGSVWDIAQNGVKARNATHQFFTTPDKQWAVDWSGQRVTPEDPFRAIMGWRVPDAVLEQWRAEGVAWPTTLGATGIQWIFEEASFERLNQYYDGWGQLTYPKPESPEC